MEGGCAGRACGEAATCSVAWEDRLASAGTRHTGLRSAQLCTHAGTLSRLAPNCNFEVTFLSLASSDGKEGKSMRVSDFPASIFHLTWMVQIPVSTNRRNRNIREPLHCALPLISSQKSLEKCALLALQMPTLPRKSGGLCPAPSSAIHPFLCFCPTPGTCLHPQVHPNFPIYKPLSSGRSVPVAGGEDTTYWTITVSSPSPEHQHSPPQVSLTSTWEVGSTVPCLRTHSQ